MILPTIQPNDQKICQLLLPGCDGAGGRLQPDHQDPEIERTELRDPTGVHAARLEICERPLNPGPDPINMFQPKFMLL